jgi:hypothetical protein
MQKIQWSEMTAVDKTIIAASPMVQGSCESPHRIVIRDLGDKYVVHMQIFDGVQKPYFDQGDYFTKTNDSAPIAHPPAAEALCKAWARFEERARRSLQMRSLERQVKEVADLAETIINYLMGDDEEHRRDEFENDYQLDSDVETFESLTGKKIRPSQTAS